MKKTISIVLSLVILMFNVSVVFSFAGNPISDKTDTDTIVFMADIHNTEANASGNRINRLLPLVASAESDMLDQVCNLGDMGHYNVYGGTYWKYAGNAMDAIDNCKYLKADIGIHIAGNHEWKNGSLASSTSANALRVEKTVGRVVTGESYEIFCFGATSQNVSYAENEYNVLDNYLCSVSDDAKRVNKQIFIITHYPLHKSSYSETRNNIDRTVSILNKYGDKLKITFVWGHNHTHKDLDPYYDYVIKPNSSIQKKIFKFTYVAAGVMSDYSDYSDTTPNIKSKCLVASINKDSGVTFKGFKNDGSSFILEKKFVEEPPDPKPEPKPGPEPKPNNGSETNQSDTSPNSDDAIPSAEPEKFVFPTLKGLKAIRINKTKIKFCWKKLSKNQLEIVSGIQIRYSYRKNMKSSKTISTSKSASCKLIKNLRANKKYYFQIRTYIKTNNGNKYSKWSPKIKKINV